MAKLSFQPANCVDKSSFFMFVPPMPATGPCRPAPTLPRPQPPCFDAYAPCSTKHGPGAPRNGPFRPARRPIREAHTARFANGCMAYSYKKRALPTVLTSAKFLHKNYRKEKNRTFCIYLRNKSLSLQCYPQTEATQWARWEGRHIYG